MSITNQKDSEQVIADFGNRQYIVDTLNSFENKFNVASWQYKGIHLWPIIKTVSFMRWFYHYNEQVKKTPPRVSTFAKFGLIKDAVLEMVRILLSPKKNISIFSTGGDWQNAQTIDKQSVNRFLHPIFEENKKRNHVYAQYSDKETHTSSNVLFLKLLALVRLSRLRNRFSKSDFSQTMNTNKEYQEFRQELSEKSKIDFNIKLSSFLESNMSEFFAYHEVYRRLLNKYNPRVCMFSGYDKIQNFALIYEAKKRNISTVDIQHGLTGNLHLGYSQFLNRPIDGYNILPSTFWCWDNESMNTIERWAKNSKDVSTFVGGNPWLSFASNQHLDIQLPENKKVILVTLQHNGIPDLIFDAIQNSPSLYYWIVRIHPRFTSIKEGLENNLKEQIENSQVLVHNAIDISLPPLLKKVHVHVTQFSSTVLEASYLGVPSVVIDSTGVSSYSHLIDQGIVLAYLGDEYSYLIDNIDQLVNADIKHDFVDVSAGTSRLEVAINQFKEIESAI